MVIGTPKICICAKLLEILKTFDAGYVFVHTNGRSLGVSDAGDAFVSINS